VTNQTAKGLIIKDLRPASCSYLSDSMISIGYDDSEFTDCTLSDITYQTLMGGEGTGFGSFV
jgi:hypothetical protein